MSVGICGTGKMGAAMAEHLMDEGESLVVWNRSSVPLLVGHPTMEINSFIR